MSRVHEVGGTRSAGYRPLAPSRRVSRRSGAAGVSSSAVMAMMATVLLMALLVPMMGCGLKKPPADKRQFVLDVSRPQASGGSAPADGILLNIRSVRVSPLYEGAGFVYRKKDGTFEEDFYNEFFSTPGYLITEELRQWMSGASFVKQVLDGDSLDLATHVLVSRVNALYADFAASPPNAVLEIEFNLQERGGAPEIVFHRVYAKALTAAGATPDDLVRA